MEKKVTPPPVKAGKDTPVAGTKPDVAKIPEMKMPDVLEETGLPGATDRITLRVSHTAMLFSGAVAMRACEFV